MLCAGSSLSGSYSLVAVCKDLIATASLVAEHRLWGERVSVVVTCGLQNGGSVAVAHGLSCPATCGIFLDQGLNPCPLHWHS